jgi:hypothetical protein
VVPQGLDVLFPFVLFGDFRSFFVGDFLGVISRPFFLGFGEGCMHETIVVLFPLIPLPNPSKVLDFGVFGVPGLEEFFAGFL